MTAPSIPRTPARPETPPGAPSASHRAPSYRRGRDGRDPSTPTWARPARGAAPAPTSGTRSALAAVAGRRIGLLTGRPTECPQARTPVPERRAAEAVATRQWAAWLGAWHRTGRSAITYVGRRAGRRVGLGVLLGVAAAGYAAYAAWPCAPWARDPAPPAERRARAAFADHLTARCEDLGPRADLFGFTCWADTEAGDLPVAPRACAGRAHRVLRLHVRPAPTAGSPTADAAARDAARDAASADPAVVTGRVLATLAAAFPDDTVLARAAGPPAAGPRAAVGGLGARGFRRVEVVRDARVAGRLSVPARDAGPALAWAPIGRERAASPASADGLYGTVVPAPEGGPKPTGRF